MATTHMTLIEYNGLELHPLYHEKHHWLLSTKEVCTAYAIEMGTLFEIQAEHNTQLIEGKHFINDTFECCGSHSSHMLFWTKKGVLRLAYYIKSQEALAFLDFIEDLHLSQSSNIDQRVAHFYDEIETTLMDKLKSIQDNPHTPLEELNKLIFTLDNLAKKRHALQHQDTHENNGLSDIINSVMGLLKMDPENLEKSVAQFVEKKFEQKQEEEKETSQRIPL